MPVTSGLTLPLLGTRRPSEMRRGASAMPRHERRSDADANPARLRLGPCWCRSCVGSPFESPFPSPCPACPARPARPARAETPQRSPRFPRLARCVPEERGCGDERKARVQRPFCASAPKETSEPRPSRHLGAPRWERAVPCRFLSTLSL